MLNDVVSCESVSVHIRRGDYLVPGNREVFHVCDLEYYREAMHWMRTHLVRPRFFVFSDDISWAMENLKAQDVVFASSTAAKATNVSDFVLMANCRHHVICNSSFSWWAAFSGPNGLVVLPEVWNRQGTPSNPDKLVPGWQCISSMATEV